MKDKMDKYEAQEGKVIEFISAEDDHYIGLVVGCDEMVGITIVDNDNHDEYLFCITGPSSPLWHKSFSKKVVSSSISFIRDQIESGVFRSDELWAFRDSLGSTSSPGHNPSQETCSFSQ